MMTDHDKVSRNRMPTASKVSPLFLEGMSRKFLDLSINMSKKPTQRYLESNCDKIVINSEKNCRKKITYRKFTGSCFHCVKNFVLTSEQFVFLLPTLLISKFSNSNR